MGRFCTHCGTEFSEGALFCRNCGARRSDSEAPTVAMKPTQPQSPSEKIVPLVFEELKKAGPLPNYNKLMQVLEKLKKEDNNPVVEALSEIVASYKHIGTMYGLLAKPETLTSEAVRAKALAGLGILPAVGGAALAGAGFGQVAADSAGNGNSGLGNRVAGGLSSGNTGRSGANGGQGYIDTTATPVRGGSGSTGSGSRWGQYLGMAAAGFAGAMLADSLHSAMSTPHYTGSGFSSPLGFGGEQGALDQYLQGDDSGSFFDSDAGDSIFSGDNSFFGGGTADASGVDTTTIDQTTVTETADTPAAFDDPNGPIDSSATTADSTTTSADPLDSYVGDDTATEATDYLDSTNTIDNLDSFDSADNYDGDIFGSSDSFFDSADDSDSSFFDGGGFFDDGGDEW